MSKRKLTHFEQTLQSHLNSIPEHKYDLWQYTEDGQIVGFYYLSVAAAFQEQSYPGWRYVVERQGKTEDITENGIKIVDLHEESITALGEQPHER
ncbi:hypothetical protein [Pantanalinema sp. GBBB05]|uniref:hypothetical protein n=1 Tax=Pantanalinema sp. GBBB05 TaxID=2604139 RepID=UPI001D3AF210|nr:hypothetical protein [Pantanalinema sp. GBBB05]